MIVWLPGSSDSPKEKHFIIMSELSVEYSIIALLKNVNNGKFRVKVTVAEYGFLSFPRKWESRIWLSKATAWIPTFVGMTIMVIWRQCRNRKICNPIPLNVSKALCWPRLNVQSGQFGGPPHPLMDWGGEFDNYLMMPASRASRWPTSLVQAAMGLPRRRAWQPLPEPSRPETAAWRPPRALPKLTCQNAPSSRASEK